MERKLQQSALHSDTSHVAPTALEQLAEGVRAGWGLLPPPPLGMVWAPVDVPALVEEVVEAVAQEAAAAAAAGQPRPLSTAAATRLPRRGGRPPRQ